MINVDQITARLAKLPDAALQQYAAMHKNDPYIMALAVSESNRRKALRQGAQGAQPGMEPPKVVDAAVEAMAPAQIQMPEDQGIARLPAGEMDFAGGGIVAFADGGDVERYQYGGNTMGAEFLFEPTLEQSALDEERRRRIISNMTREERLRRFNTADVEAALRGPAVPAPAAVPPATVPPTTVPPVAVPPAVVPPAAAGNPPAPGPRRPPGASTSPTPPTAPAAASAAPEGLSDLNTMLKKALESQKYEDPAKKQVEELGGILQEGAKGRLSAFDEYVAKTGDIFKGREERLGKREAELGKQRDQNTGLAILNAGLAIMSTPGGLATAIGKGARVGTEQFAAGLDKIRAAQDRLEDARDKIDELRVNRADMTFKERQALQGDIDKARADALRLSIDGTRQAAGVTEKRAADLVTNQVRVGISQFEQAEATKRTGMEIAGRKEAAGITAAATRETANATRMAAIMDNLQKRIATEARERFPLDPTAQAQYERTAFAEAVRNNPALAQYIGVPAGSAPAAPAPSLRYNVQTGKFEPVR